jgi:hypothetical protein
LMPPSSLRRHARQSSPSPYDGVLRHMPVFFAD